MEKGSVVKFIYEKSNVGRGRPAERMQYVAGWELAPFVAEFKERNGKRYAIGL